MTDLLSHVGGYVQYNSIESLFHKGTHGYR